MNQNLGRREFRASPRAEDPGGPGPRDRRGALGVREGVRDVRDGESQAQRFLLGFESSPWGGAGLLDLDLFGFLVNVINSPVGGRLK